MKLYYKISICVFTSLVLGALGGILTRGAIQSWLPFIQKPTWNPPNWIFGPVWTILYILIGTSIAIVWHSEKLNKNRAYQFFVIQAILNLLWTPVFFGLHDIFIALVVIILMVLFISLTMIEFYRINKLATYLLLPYLLWVSFASILNGNIYWLNK